MKEEHSDSDLASEMMKQDIIACHTSYDSQYPYLKGLKDSVFESDIEKHLLQCYCNILDTIGSPTVFPLKIKGICHEIFKSNYYMPEGELEIDLVDDVPITELHPEVVFRDPTTGQILKLDLQGARQRLGILHYELDQTNGVLRLDSIPPENWT